jgi:hypothetical protein
MTLKPRLIVIGIKNKTCLPFAFSHYTHFSIKLEDVVNEWVSKSKGELAPANFKFIRMRVP